ncbi:glycosyl hydrolase family 28-related protein [Providencia alcalifaciens]|uniref:glycosyl hydrolase family 28-related protein n=1 Tax=Providencia alcalifaciens TaxID=126385 RepID=UPI001CC40FA5|nr:glycosyl hydrolase family 28-related protein [Providencia alcalifaciens]CAG9417773.1 hypothetical protein NVI2019_OHEONHNH_01574 [Providencia alcalifaciens]CAG9419193.1 hypothetical protein NVI2019_PLFLNFOB_01747 [Providencia alcalifaciens]CAG9421816.1 hypothetical protein NVI2019_KOLGMIGM_02070 [Providencia alcalifaciens]CAG9422827.1 hypothetical protein NVI2019_OGMBKCAO_02070 [Providencia alcalifaciens]CAG9423060.1 hypothetical protein NVI2019_ANGEOOBF_02069 [Providencia alcalifaciens]
MTVSTEISSNEYTGNGVTTDFDYKFRIFKVSDLSVTTSDADGDNVVTLRLGTDYTVTGANKSAGGKVILTKPLTDKHQISISRVIPIVQETSFRNQGKFLAETHEDAFDYLTMLMQRLWGSLSLFLKRPSILANWFDAKGYRIANLGKPKRDSDAVDLGTLKDEISGVNSTILKRENRLLRVDDMDIAALPNTSERAGNVLTFDKDGKPIVVAPATGSAVDVLNQLGRESGAGLSGFSHDVPYAPATVGHKLKNSVWVTDAPFNAKMDGVTDDTSAFQKAIDSGKIVQIPNGQILTSDLTIYPNTTIIGSGRKHGIKGNSGTQIIYKGIENSNWLTLKDRDGMKGDGQGTVILKAFSCINASDYLELPSHSEPYFLYRPNPQKVLDSNSRGLFAVESTHVDWGAHSDWQAAKEGGVNCPFLIIDDVKLQNFTYPIDVHTWMCQISNFEPYLCGPVRLSGTSTKITNSWPRNPLSVAWQVGVQYSNMSASSLGEGVYNNFGNNGNGGLECYFGFITLNDVGYELIRGTVLNAYKGTIKVDNLTGVTGSTDRPSRLGKISGSEGFIIWGCIPKMQNREGVQISLAFNLFAAINEDLLGNHMFQTPTHAKNLWITNPWESKLGNSSQLEYFAPYVSQSDNTIIGSPFVTYPLKDNKTREVGSLKVGYKNSVLIRGAGRVHRFRIFGSFDDGITSAASTNPRQKHGMLRIDFTHYASPLADGTSSAIDNFKTAHAILTFSRTLEGRVYDTVLSDSVSTGNDKPIFFRVIQESDGGFTVEFGVTRVIDGKDEYRQCLVDVHYTGSYPRNTDNNSVSLMLG